MFPDQVIYTASGDLTTLNAILNAVAMVCQENATIFSFALAAAMWSLFSMTVVGSAGAASGGAGPDLARRAFALLIPFCLAICLTSSSMKTTVTVESGLTGATTSVDNIPVIISVVPATASLLSKIVGQKLETAMQLTSNDYNSIASSQQGFVNPLKTLLTSRTAVMRMGGIASEVNSLLASCLNNDSGADYASIANHVQFAGNLPSADAGPTPISVWSGVGTSRTSIGVLLGEAAQNTSAFVTDIKVGSNDIATCADAAEQVGTDIDAALSSDQFKRIVRGAVNVADNPNPSADYSIAGLATMYAAIRTANSAGASAQPEVELINLLFAELVRNDLECLRADGTNKSTCLAMAVQSNDIERNNIQAAANGFDALMYAGAFANQLTAIIIGLGPVLVLFMMFAGAGAARNMKVATHMIVWPLLIMNVGAEMINGMVYISVANFLSALAQGGVINQSAAVEVYKYFALQIGTSNHLMATLPILMSTIFALGESAALVRIGDSMTSGPQGDAKPAAEPTPAHNAPAATSSSVAGADHGFAGAGAGAAAGLSGTVPAFAASAQFGSVQREAAHGITSAQQKMQALSDGTSNLAAWQGALASGDYSKVGLSASTGNALRDVFQQTHGAAQGGTGAGADPLAMSRSLASSIDNFLQGDGAGRIGSEEAQALQRSAGIQKQYARTLAESPSPADVANDAVKRSAGLASLSGKIGSADIAGQMRTNPAFRQFQLNEGHVFGRMAAAQPYLEQARQDMASGAADGIAGDTPASDALARHRAALAMATDGQAAPEDRLRANQYLLGTTNAMLAGRFIAPDAQPRTAGGQDAAAGDEALARPAAATDAHPAVLQTYSEDELRHAGLHLPAGTRFLVQPESMESGSAADGAPAAAGVPEHASAHADAASGANDGAVRPAAFTAAGDPFDGIDMQSVLKDGELTASLGGGRGSPIRPWSGDGEVMADFDPQGRVHADAYAYQNRGTRNDAPSSPLDTSSDASDTPAAAPAAAPTDTVGAAAADTAAVDAPAGTDAWAAATDAPDASDTAVADGGATLPADAVPRSPIESWNGDGETMADFDPAGRVHPDAHAYQSDGADDGSLAPAPDITAADLTMPRVVVSAKRPSRQDPAAQAAPVPARTPTPAAHAAGEAPHAARPQGSTQPRPPAPAPTQPGRAAAVFAAANAAPPRATATPPHAPAAAPAAGHGATPAIPASTGPGRQAATGGQGQGQGHQSAPAAHPPAAPPAHRAAPAKRKPYFWPDAPEVKQQWDAAKGRLVDAAQRTGVDPGIMARIAGFESHFKTNARPIAGEKRKHLNKIRQFDGVMAMSSAYGYGQFTDDTWTGVLRSYGENYGIKNAKKLTDTTAAGYRKNEDLQAAMLAEFTKSNIEQGRKLGGPNDDANVYALHNLGSGAGPKFLRKLASNPNARVDDVLSDDVIAGNSGLYGDGSLTVQESYNRMAAAMAYGDRFAVEARAMREAKYGKTASGKAPAVAPLPKTAPPASTVRPSETARAATTAHPPEAMRTAAPARAPETARATATAHTPEATRPAATAPQVTSPRFESPARPGDVSLHSLQVLNSIAKSAGVNVADLQVTSTKRMPQDQARIMYDQLRSKKISKYGEAGQSAIEVYNQGVERGDTPDQIKAAMTDRIQYYLAKNKPVSNHMGDQSALNVFDISPKSIPTGKIKAFEAALDEAQRTHQIKRYHGPHTAVHDPAYHLEIPQPPKH